MKKSTKGILATTILGASLLLGACDMNFGKESGKGKPGTCEGVTATNIIEAGGFVDVVDAYMNVTTQPGLNETILTKANDLLMGVIDKGEIEVITQEDAEYKVSFKEYKKHAENMVTYANDFIKDPGQDAITKMQGEIEAMSDFLVLHNVAKGSCGK